jgi:hypothetical protein
LEQDLQAEYQRVANGVYPFERVGGSASHIYIINENNKQKHNTN